MHERIDGGLASGFTGATNQGSQLGARSNVQMAPIMALPHSLSLSECQGLGTNPNSSASFFYFFIHFVIVAVVGLL